MNCPHENAIYDEDADMWFCPECEHEWPEELDDLDFEDEDDGEDFYAYLPDDDEDPEDLI